MTSGWVSAPALAIHVFPSVVTVSQFFASHEVQPVVSEADQVSVRLEGPGSILQALEIAFRQHGGGSTLGIMGSESSGAPVLGGECSMESMGVSFNPRQQC